MSKRKNRSTSPNLPQDVLERARRQIAEERGEVVPPPAVEKPAAEKPKVAAPAPAPRPASAARTAAVTPGTSRRRTALEPVKAKRRDDEPLSADMEYIRNRLEHPTRFPTEDQLREQYTYVIRDLRRMALLSATLIIVLIVIALVF
jgi:hypothetical protein